jgi:hypothetical protein
VRVLPHRPFLLLLLLGLLLLLLARRLVCGGAGRQALGRWVREQQGVCACIASARCYITPQIS